MEPDVTKMNPGQLEVHKLITEEWRSDYFSPLSMMTQITEEVGEIARFMNREYGDQRKKDSEVLDLESEIGDTLFSLSCLANKMGINLDEALRKTLDEKRGRDKNRFAEKS